jgi:hypothetical protein
MISSTKFLICFRAYSAAQGQQGDETRWGRVRPTMMRGRHRATASVHIYRRCTSCSQWCRNGGGGRRGGKAAKCWGHCLQIHSRRIMQLLPDNGFWIRETPASRLLARPPRHLSLGVVVIVFIASFPMRSIHAIVREHTSTER